jgi:hypothetical protein
MYKKQEDFFAERALGTIVGKPPGEEEKKIFEFSWFKIRPYQFSFRWSENCFKIEAFEAIEERTVLRAIWDFKNNTHLSYIL